MTESLNLADLIAAAEAAGADFKAVKVDPDTYRVRVLRTNFKQSKAGNPGFGIQVEIIEGPETGKKFWSNFYLTPVKKDGEPNHAGVSIFFRLMEALGVPTEEFRSGATSVKQVVESGRLVGTIADAVVVDDNFNPDEVKSKVDNFKKVAQQGFATAAPQGYVPPAPAAPTTVQQATTYVAPPVDTGAGFAPASAPAPGQAEPF